MCGPVDIYPVGRGWICLNKKAESARKWAQDNPERMRASRAKPGSHRLLTRRGFVAECILCGPVTAVPWGRGYTCSVRANELRTKQQAAPIARCPDCNKWLSGEYPVFSGRCEACRDISTPGRSLNGLKGYGRNPDAALDVSAALDNDLSMARWYSLNKPDDGKDRTKPRLRTLGDRNVPEEWAWALKRDPEWWRLDQMGSPTEGGTRTKGGSVMHYGLSSGITGHSVTEGADSVVTLVDAYRDRRTRGQTFPEFKAAYLRGLDVVGVPITNPVVMSMLAYPGSGNDELEDDYTVVD